MSRADKPYRRFRARGRSGDGDGLEALRQINRERSGEGPGGPEPQPSRPSRPSRPPRGERRALRRDRRTRSREGRPWYSLRGLGPAGWLGRIALVVGVIVIAWAAFGLLALRGAVGEANARVGPGVPAALDRPDGGMLGTPTNTLIIGSDARRGETRSRADTILIMRTDPEEGRVKYLSIPRDFRVSLPRRGEQKINAAFRFGGQRGMINAVKNLTGLPIHHIMVIKFGGFPELVDRLGGVTVTNPTELVDCPYPAGRRVSFPKGEIKLDGETALEFARVRSCDSDLERARRQQALLAGMKKKVFSLGSLPRAPWRGADIVRVLHTDIGAIDIVKFGWLQARLDQEPSDRILLSGTPQTIGGISYIIADPDANEREIARFVGP